MRNLLDEDEQLTLDDDLKPEPSDWAKLRSEFQEMELPAEEMDEAEDLTPGPAPKAQPKAVDLELTKAQEKARRVSKSANMGRVASDIAGAFGGYKPDTRFYDGLEQQGRQGVADLKERRASAAGQQKAARDSAAYDPTSPASVTFRETVERLDPKYADMLKKKGLWERISAADKASIYDPIKLKSELEARHADTVAKAAAAGATAQEKRDNSARDDAAIGDLIKRTYKEQLAAAGQDSQFVDSLSLAGKKSLLIDLQQRRGQDAAADRQQTGQSFTATQKDTDREIDSEKHERERTVNGRGLALDAPSAKTVREIDANTANLATAIDTLKQLHSKYGGRSLAEVADTDGSIGTAVENAQSAYRVFANLGVPSGKDAELSEAAVNDPKKFKNMLLGRGTASWDIMIDTAKKQADAKARSYIQAKPQVKASTTPMIDPENGKVTLVRNDEVEQAMKHGWKRK